MAEDNTLEALREHPEIARFLEWVRRRPGDEHVQVRRSADMRRRGKTGRGRREGGIRHHG